MKIQNLLRGISQIYFANNPYTGLLILTGIAIFDLRTAVLVALGALVQTFTGIILKRHDAVAQGLFGFNGALVGAAAGVQLQNWPVSLVMTVLGAALCTPVHLVFEKLFSAPLLVQAALPVSTAPFCAVTGTLITLLAPFTTTGGTLSSGTGATGIMTGLANNFSEVVLADGVIAGVLIAAGLFLADISLGGFALWGSAFSLLIASLMHGGLITASTGLYGYSAVLVSIAIGATFWKDRPLSARIIGATVGVLLTMCIQPLLALTPIPVYTWPFLLSMWIVMLVGSKFTPTAQK